MSKATLYNEILFEVKIVSSWNIVILLKIKVKKNEKDYKECDLPLKSAKEIAFLNELSLTPQVTLLLSLCEGLYP